MKHCAVVVPVYNEEAVIGRLLDALSVQTVQPELIIIVDNGSTDSTAGIVRQYAEDHATMKIQVFSEPQKGTGAASDTGFREAIRSGYGLILRTDADSVPQPEWVETMLDSAEKNSDAQLFAGQILPLHDEWYKYGDRMLLPVGLFIIRFGLAVRHRDRGYMQMAIGSNLMIRSDAYLAVTGFPRVGIDLADEDIELTQQIRQRFSSSAIKSVRDARVAVSMRRPRAQGAWATLFRHIFADYRRKQQFHDVR